MATLDYAPKRHVLKRITKDTRVVTKTYQTTHLVAHMRWIEEMENGSLIVQYCMKNTFDWE